MPKLCRFCQHPCPQSQDASPNWWCPSCATFDGDRCAACQTRTGFPLEKRCVTVEEAQASPQCRNDEGAALRIWRRALVYCARCFHNLNFTETVGEVTGCHLCQSKWERGTLQVHPLLGDPETGWTG